MNLVKILVLITLSVVLNVAEASPRVELQRQMDVITKLNKQAAALNLTLVSSRHFKRIANMRVFVFMTYQAQCLEDPTNVEECYFELNLD